MAMLYSCVPATEEVPTIDLDIDFDRTRTQHIWDEIDRRNMDSIQYYLGHIDPNKRALAARSLYTIRDTSLIDSLADLLNDPVRYVRESAAFALGQSGHASATPHLVAAFDALDSLAGQRLFNTYLLEAVGKTGQASDEKNIASVKTYTSADIKLIEGQALALYRFALRNITSEAGVDKVMDILSDAGNPPQARLYAAHYLARARQLDLKRYDEQLHELAKMESDPNIRLALAASFKHLKTDFGYQSLKDWLKTEQDIRVKVVILRTLISFENKNIEDLINEAMKDSDINFATIAAQHLVDYISPTSTVQLRRKTRAANSMPWQVRSNMYLAANKLMSNNYRISKENMNNEIEQLYKSTKNVYGKAAYLKAWAQYGINLDKIISEYYSTRSPIIKSTVISTVLDLTSPENIKTVYAGMQNTAKTKVADLLKKGISSGDPSTIAAGCNGILNNYKAWKPYFNDYEFVKSAMDSLDLPKDYEAHYEAKRLYNKWINKKEEINKPIYNHPIDWTWVSDLPDTVQVSITTDQGDIECHLYKQQAPGTVANFVQLSEAEFYDGKYFHRVIPSFVVQAGCPIGNGFGSLDYTIRSEFMPLYYDRPGRMGMASLGADTEGTQWFITHTATPHLDGRYTIFGQVVRGMDVVNQIKVGDKINKIKIMNL